MNFARVESDELREGMVAFMEKRLPRWIPTGRAKLGWKWSVVDERHRIPGGWAIDGANLNDVRLLEPTLDAVADTRLLADTGTMHLDCAYNFPRN